MFHPTGSKPPAVYWRRRLLLVGLAVVSGLTLYAACSSSERPAAQPAPPTTTAHDRPSAASPSPSQSHAPTSSAAPSSAASSAAPVANQCPAKALQVSAVTSAASFHVGDHPTLSLQVVNTGKKPCVEDLADKQIELRVYNGSSRVWGSHDCQVQPGTSPQTLPVGTAVRRSVVWTGLSSQPKCLGERVRVGAGTYTLHAILSGHDGKTATFTMAG